MQFTATRTELLGALKRTSAAVTPGDQVAYKSSVLIEAKPESPLVMGATDSVLGVVCELQATIGAPGQAVLPHKRLFSIINEMPPGMVEVTVDDKTFKTVIKSKETKRRAAVSGLDPADYPPLLKLSAMTGDELFRIESKILQQAAGEVGFAIDPGFVDGVLLAPIDTGKFQLVALSGSAFVSAVGFFTQPAASQSEVVFPGISSRPRASSGLTKPSASSAWTRRRSR